MGAREVVRSYQELDRAHAGVVHALARVELFATRKALPGLRDWSTELEMHLGAYLDAPAPIPREPCEVTGEVLKTLMARLKLAVESRSFDGAARAAADLRDELASHHRARAVAATAEPGARRGPTFRS